MNTHRPDRVTLASVVALVLFLGLSAGFMAQGPRRGGGPRGDFGGFGPVGLPLRSLDLTEDQKTQVKSITDAARTESEPIQQQLRDLRDQLETAIESGGDLQGLSSQQGQLTGQLTYIHARTQSQIYALLTPQQKDKLAASQAERKQRREEFRNRFQSRTNGNSNP